MSIEKVLTEQKVKNMSPITLAFIGDAVYSLHVRLKTALEGDFRTGEMNERTSSKVCAVAQAGLIDALLPHLSRDEEEIYRRARNAKKPSRSKHSTVAQYNKSTGFEAVVGYLYLTGQSDRLDYILNFEERINEG